MHRLNSSQMEGRRALEALRIPKQRTAVRPAVTEWKVTYMDPDNFGQAVLERVVQDDELTDYLTERLPQTVTIPGFGTYKTKCRVLRIEAN